MDLKPISFQSDSSDVPFSQYYESFMEVACKNDSASTNPAIEAQLFEVARRQRKLPFVTVALIAEVRKKQLEAAASTRKRCENVLQFIRILENDFSGPPQWLCTSHYDVVFHHTDFKDISDTPEDGRGVTLVVRYDQTGSGKFQLQAGSSTLEVSEALEAADSAAKILNQSGNL